MGGLRDRGGRARAEADRAGGPRSRRGVLAPALAAGSADGEGGEVEDHVQGGEAEHDVHLFVGRGGVQLDEEDAGDEDGGGPAEVPPEAGDEAEELADDGVGGDEEGHGEAAGAAFTEAHGEGALAGFGVFAAVADVVDFDEQAGEQAADDAHADGGAVDGGVGGLPAELDEDGAGDGDEAEEEQDEELTEAVVGERVGPAGVAVGEEEAGDADGEDGPALGLDQGDGEAAGAEEEGAAPEFDGAGAHGAAGGDAAGALSLGGVGVALGVDGVVEEVAGDLDAHAAEGCVEGQGQVEGDAGAREGLLELVDDEAAGPDGDEAGGQGFGPCGEDDGCDGVHEGVALWGDLRVGGLSGWRLQGGAFRGESRGAAARR